MDQVFLSLVGPLKATRAGGSCPLPGGKSAALIVLLAVRRVVWRAEAAALLWPAAADPRASLRVALAGVRRALGGEALETHGDRLVFRAATDLEQLEGQLSGDEPNLSSVLPLARGQLAEGLVLPDAPDFDAWVTGERAIWRNRLANAFARWSRNLLDAGNLRDATSTVERWIALDPLDEGAVRRLMEIQIATGATSAARRTFLDLARRLDQELGVRPEPATFALLVDIDDALRRPRAAARGPGELLFAGRGPELARLAALFGNAGTETPAVAVLEGETGIGKSRLAREFLRWADRQGAVTLSGRAFQLSGALPYAAVVEAIRRPLAMINALDDLLDDVWLVELSRFLPEIRERYPDLPTPTSDPHARTRLFEAVSRALEALAGNRPLVFHIDYVHWADGGTRDLLEYLAGRRSGRPRRLLLLTVRSEQRRSDGVLARWLADLVGDGGERLVLGPLDPAATRRIVAGIADSDDEATSRLADWLQRESGGQPFYLAETINLLVERYRGSGRLDAAQILAREPRSVVPPTVRDAVTGRISRLSGAGRALVTAAAVVVRSAPFELLCHVAGLGEEAALNAVDELIAEGLLTERDGGYLISHDRVREIVYEHAGAARRSMFHRRTAAALVERGAAAAEIADHTERAGLRADATRWWVAAGDEAMRLFVVSEAISHWERAIAQPNALPEADVGAVLLKLGRALELAGRPKEAEDRYRTAAEQGFTAAEQAAALGRLAILAVHRDLDLGAADGFLERALVLAATAPLAVQAEIGWVAAQVAFYAWRPDVGLRHAKAALLLSRLVGDAEIELRCMNVLEFLRQAFGAWEETVAEQERAIGLARRLGDRSLEVESRCQRAVALLNLGRPAEAEAEAEAALPIARAIGNPWGMANAQATLALAYGEQGRLAEAARAARDAIRAADADASPIISVVVRSAAGAVARAGLALGEAATIHREARAIANRQGVVNLAELVGVELATDLAMAGDDEGAIAEIEQALELRQAALLFVMGWTRAFEAEVLLRAGKAPAVRRELARYRALAEESPRHRLVVEQISGALAEAAGNRVEARHHYLTAVAESARLCLPIERWWALVRLARLGDLDAQEQAREVIRDLASHHDQPDWFLAAAERVMRIVGRPLMAANRAERA